MKELRGSASGLVSAPLQQCMALLQAVDGYPDWYPEVVKEVEVVERDAEGAPTRVRTKLHVARGPLVRDFELLMTIAVAADTVRLLRVADDAEDQERFEVTWQLQGARETRIELALDANLAVPRMLPLGGVGDGLAEGFVGAAIKALR